MTVTDVRLNASDGTCFYVTSCSMPTLVFPALARLTFSVQTPLLSLFSNGNFSSMKSVFQWFIAYDACLPLLFASLAATSTSICTISWMMHVWCIGGVCIFHTYRVLCICTCVPLFAYLCISLSIFVYTGVVTGSLCDRSPL